MSSQDKEKGLDIFFKAVNGNRVNCKFSSNFGDLVKQSIKGKEDITELNDWVGSGKHGFKLGLILDLG